MTKKAAMKIRSAARLLKEAEQASGWAEPLVAIHRRTLLMLLIRDHVDLLNDVEATELSEEMSHG